MQIETVYLISNNEKDVVEEPLKDKIKNVLDVPGDLSVVDLGNHEFVTSKSLLAKIVSENEKSVGISFSNDIIGHSIMFNRDRGIKALPAFNINIIEKSRKDFNSNVLCVSFDMFTFEDNRDMIKKFIETDFDFDNLDSFFKNFALEEL